jgi:hypothetical protein
MWDGSSTVWVKTRWVIATRVANRRIAQIAIAAGQWRRGPRLEVDIAGRV